MNTAKNPETKSRRFFLQKLCFGFFVLCALGTRISLAEEPSALKDTNFSQKIILDNGLTVILYEMPTSTTVAVYTVVKTGSATEGEFLGTGISHFVEHMMFKGTEKRGVGQVADEVKALGGMINASTSLDYTVYLIELPNQYYAQAIDIMSDMIMNSKIDPQEVEKERQVIFGEVRLYRDRPERKLSEMVQANVYLSHPYHHPIIGYDALLNGITRENIWKYYKRAYIPNNMVVAIAGNIHSDEILKEIKKTFGTFKRQPDVLRNLPPEPPQITERYYEDEYKTDITRLDMAYQGVGILNEDIYALDVLAMVLGQGSSSRLQRELYDKQKIVTSIHTGDFTPVDKGTFEIESELQLPNLEKVISETKKVVGQIQKNGITPDELNRAKAQVLSGHVFSKQTAGSMADEMAYDEAFAGDYQFSANYVKAVNRLTVDDIKRVANKYLRDTNLTTVVLKPEGSLAVKKSDVEKGPAGEIKKITLDNGLKILLREDHTFPLVFIRLALQGGTRQETLELSGLSRLMAGLWVRETKSLSIQALADLTASKGVSIGEIAGRNSFGIEFYGLSDYKNLGMDLIEDMVKNPKFSEEEFKKAKERTRVVIQSQKEDISYVTGQNLRETLFPEHPFRLQESGTAESMDRIQLADVLDFYNKFVAPNNMVLSVAGDITEKEALELAKKKFGDLKAKDVVIKDSPVAPLTAMIEKTVRLDRTQAIVMIGFQGPKLSAEDVYPVAIINSIVSAPLSGRMFNKIRDQLGKSYTLGGGYAPGVDAGFIYFYVNTTDENVDKVKEVLLDEIKDIQTNLVPDEEFNRSKMYLKGTYQRSLETTSGISSLATFDELYGLGFDNYKKYAPEIDKVTAEDIRNIAAKYLDLNHAAVILTRPSKAAVQEPDKGPGGTNP